MDIRHLDKRASAAPQIAPTEIEQVKAAGFAALLNNRPDHEEPGQPTSEQMSSAAAAAGLRYAHIPLGQEPLTAEMINAVREALDAANGATLLFCRSGTRSTTLWGLAEAMAGRDIDDIVACASAAGYDLNPYRGAMQALATAD
ncbi:MAG: TIGR01244 family sulfur transferase [Pacificimonas sp.]